MLVFLVVLILYFVLESILLAHLIQVMVAAVEVVVRSITVLSILLLQPVHRVAERVAMQTLQRIQLVRLAQQIAVAVAARVIQPLVVTVVLAAAAAEQWAQPLEVLAITMA